MQHNYFIKNPKNKDGRETMERGAPLSHYQPPKSNSGMSLDQHNNMACDDKNKSTVLPQQPCVVREQDECMPKASVKRIMRKILPPSVRISGDAKEAMQECVSEFINFVTSEANERCQLDKRQTITAEDILCAMSELGFENYVGPLNMFINRYREFETGRGGSLGGESSSFKPAFGASSFGFQGPPPPGPYGYGLLDQSMVMDGGRYYQNRSGQDGSSGGGGSSSSLNGMPVYDQYGQYK